MSKKNPRPVPRFESPIIETHCHLDYLDVEQLDETLAKTSDIGVETIITIAVSPDNLAAVRALTERSDRIFGTQGIHPHEADHWNNEVLEAVRSGAAHPRIVAIGEIGLDYYHDHADRRAQAVAFEAQLALAIDLDLPVVVHTREADADTRAMLANVSDQLTRKGVIHSFTSSLELAEWCLSEGFCLGFNGITTFNRADNVREVVRATPVSQILLETDAPYLTPVPYRGRVNSPYYLPLIAEKIAELKEIDVETLITTTYKNSRKLFFSHD